MGGGGGWGAVWGGSVQVVSRAGVGGWVGLEKKLRACNTVEVRMSG